MKLKTKSFGEVEINEKDIINIKEGIFGFPEYEKFILLMSDNEQPFAWLQSIDEPMLAFIVIQPELFKYNFKLNVGEEFLKKIGIEKMENILTYSIVVIPENDNKRMTANLQGPIIINSITKVGCQAISLNPKYTVRHNIMEELSYKKKMESKGK